jgi:hypothetical protein
MNLVSAVRPMTDSTSLSCLPLLGPNEPHAPIAILSTAKRAALVACLTGGPLCKYGRVWIVPSSPNEKPIANTTIADLGRQGMLAVSVLGRNRSARLTPRGSWFARTLAAREVELAKANSI